MKYRLTEDWLEYKKGHLFNDVPTTHEDVETGDSFGNAPVIIRHRNKVKPVELSLLLKTGILEEVKEIEIVPSGRIDYCCECGNEHGYDCPLSQVKEKLDEVKTLLLSLKK